MRSHTVVFILAALAAAPLCATRQQAQSGTVNSQTSDARLSHIKAQARRVYEEGLSQGIFEVAYAPDFVGHGGSGSTFSHEAGVNEARGWRMAFPDLKVNVDLIVAEGDLVSVRWTARGTNTGTGNGIPATGKRVQTSGTTVFRFVNDTIAEEWTAGDALGLLKQLGLTPPPAATATQVE